MTPSLTQVMKSTSDEVGFLLIEQRPRWTLHPVKFAWRTGPSLLELDLLKFEPAYVPPKPKPRHHHVKPVHLDSTDPWEVGEATAASQPSVISFPRAVPNVVA